MDMLLKTLIVLYTTINLSNALTDSEIIKLPTDSTVKPLKKNCCKNNGVCVLGSFCKCKKGYFGRYCEYKIEFKPCGRVLHGSWFKADCDLCKCFDGKMSCIPRVYDGCDDNGAFLLPMMTTQDPLKAKNMKVIGNDRDYQDDEQPEFNLDDVYYTAEENSSTNVSYSCLHLWIILFCSILVLR